MRLLLQGGLLSFSLNFIVIVFYLGDVPTESETVQAAPPGIQSGIVRGRKNIMDSLWLEKRRTARHVRVSYSLERPRDRTNTLPYWQRGFCCACCHRIQAAGSAAVGLRFKWKLSCAKCTGSIHPSIAITVRRLGAPASPPSSQLIGAIARWGRRKDGGTRAGGVGWLGRMAFQPRGEGGPLQDTA